CVVGKSLIDLKSKLYKKYKAKSINHFFAYTTEVLPWLGDNSFYPSINNFTQFNISVLFLSQNLYNRSTLPTEEKYFADPEHNSLVLRQVLNPGQFTTCAAILFRFPGLIFYNPSMNELACGLIGLNASLSEGACILVRVLAIPIAHKCLWITKGNELNYSNEMNTCTVTFVLTQYFYPTLLWLKFILRFIASIIIILCLWNDYFRHYFALVKALAHHGYRHNLDKTAIWRYQLVIGDVWFAYGSIGIMNYILKWSK
ncbi:hypothetical protein THRCLA_03658, partial [Thraustotheca clavata]